MNAKTKNSLALAGLGIGALLVAQAASRRASRIDLSGKVVIITGGSRGLGLEIGRQLAAQNAKLAICARDAQELERGRAVLEACGAEVFAMRCDVGDEQQVAEFVARVEQRFGGADVLINNAGVIQVAPAAHVQLADFEEAMRINFWGALYMTFAVLPLMRRRGEGRIVNISSFGGKISVPHLLPYCASKHALNGLSEGLRAELRSENIIVTTVIPGLLRTGSHLNIDIKGRHAEEYAWFSFGATMPVLSMNSERAAQRIVLGMREGRGQIVLPLQTNLALAFHALFPDTTNALLAFVARLLPAPNPNSEGNQKRKGYESREAEPKTAEVFGAHVAERNNEI